MNTRCFADLRIEWDIGNLPVDPFAPVLPLALLESREPDARATSAAADLVIVARLTPAPAPSPAAEGALPVIFHGKTRCFLADAELVLWDGASTLRISSDGRRIDAAVHASSLERVFHFSSVTVMMALLLALRHRGLFHLHAAAAQWPDGETWVIPGESNSGKSTLALAAFSAGARWLSDDALLLRAVDRDVEIVGWARMIRMTAVTADAFPALRPLLTACPPGSARDFEVDPRAAFAGRGQQCVRPPVTLLYPSIASLEHSHVTPLDDAEAFGRTLHACAWVASEHLPRRQEQLDLLARLIDRARAFELHVGTRLLQDPAAAVDEIRQLVKAS